MVVDAKPEDQKLPTDAYFAVEEVHDVSWPENKLMWYVNNERHYIPESRMGIARQHLLY